MFQPTDKFQVCIGASAVLVSLGVCCSLITGSVVRVSVAGANLSVNESIRQTEKIADTLSETTKALKNEPGVSRLKIKAIEQELRQVDRKLDKESDDVEEHLNQYIEPETRQQL